MWRHFKRLLLGTVIEALLEAGLAVDFASIRLDFDDDSAFRVPRLDNYMRFKGHLSARLQGPLAEGQRHALERSLRGVWPDLLAVVDIPIGDRLGLERNDVRVQVEDGVLRVVFDLEAD